VEEFKEVDIIFLAPEVLLEKEINSRFEEEGVVDGDVADLGHAIPAWLSTTRDGTVHDIVCDEEHSLELTVMMVSFSACG
jgi:hypothetical protein